MQKNRKHNFAVILPSLKKTIYTSGNENLLETLLKEGVFINADCGGIGKCGRCRVNILKENKMFSALSCKIKIDSNLAVTIPDEYKPLAQKKKIKKLSSRYAIAIDLGSTTITGSLINLTTNKEDLRYSTYNPLIPYGADILSRASRTLENKGLIAHFKSLLESCVNNLIDAMAYDVKSRIVSVVIAGNTVMEHFLLGLSVKSVVKYPFVSKFKRLITTCPCKLNLNLPGNCKVFIFPVASSFVGGDALTAAFSVLNEENFMMVDIGTNAEVIFKDGDILVASSSPAGPAFEGGELSCGVRNMPGAVDFVDFKEGKFKVKTISGKKPAGICGGGLFSLISLLLKHGVVKPDGNFSDSSEIHAQLALRMFEVNGEKGFSVYRDASSNIYITQGDIRKFQLAKGALKAVVELVAENNKISKIFITGNFGSAINGDVFKDVGIFPDSFKGDVIFSGNAVIEGCKKFLVDENGIKELERIRKKIRVIDTSGSKKFEKLFIKSLYF